MPRKKVHPEAAEDCLKVLGIKSWVEAFVLLGYGDVYDLPVRSLDFRTENLNPEQLIPGIRVVPGYNNFDGDRVADAVAMLHREGMLMSVPFGREGSPVLYLNIPYWTHQRSNEKAWGQGEQIPEELREHYFTWIEDAMRGLRADEIDRIEVASGMASPGIRAWWD